MNLVLLPSLCCSTVPMRRSNQACNGGTEKDAVDVVVQLRFLMFVPWSSCCISISIGINSTWWFVVVVVQLPVAIFVPILVLFNFLFCYVLFFLCCIFVQVVCVKSSGSFLQNLTTSRCVFFLPCVVVAVIEIASHYALLVLGFWYSVVKVLVAFCRSFSARLTSRCIIGLSLALLAHSAPAAEKWFSERKIVR